MKFSKPHDHTLNVPTLIKLMDAHTGQARQLDMGVTHCGDIQVSFVVCNERFIKTIQREHFYCPQAHTQAAIYARYQLRLAAANRSGSAWERHHLTWAAEREYDAALNYYRKEQHNGESTNQDRVQGDHQAVPFRSLCGQDRRDD